MEKDVFESLAIQLKYVWLNKMKVEWMFAEFASPFKLKKKKENRFKLHFWNSEEPFLTDFFFKTYA